MTSQYQIPATPRVISPSPTPSELSGKDGYFPPTTRSKAAGNRLGSVEDVEEQNDEGPGLADARGRSRSPQLERRSTRQLPMNGGPATSTPTAVKVDGATRRRRPEDLSPSATNKPLGPAKANGFLSPDSAYPQGFGSAYWRNLSRSPSPLGLIPIHREWRAFVHKHEVPRKALHVSIGFFTLWLYYAGAQTSDIHPVLLGLLIPILTLDLVRFRYPAFNRLYIKAVGAFMRESEAHDRFNGVISYLAGLWLTMRFCRKDVAVVTVLLLSWCDTAASTFGRLWGKYTPRIRKGKSLAGSLAAFTFGVASAIVFWGMVAPMSDQGLNYGENRFAFQNALTLPALTRERLGVSVTQATIEGPVALVVLSLVSGLIVSVSEAVDLWGLDDNLTIPVLSGLALGAFLWVFGAP